MASSVTVAPTLLAAPAHADDSGLVLSVPSQAEVWQYPASQHPHVTELPFKFGKAGGAELANYRLTADTSGIAGIAKPEDDWLAGHGCSTEGTQYTCTDPGLARVPYLDETRLKLTALPGGQVGATGSIHFTESADGLPTRTADVQVKITEGSPELDLSPLQDRIHSVETTPGSQLPESLTVTNLGPVPTNKIVVELSLIHGLSLPKSFTDCEYARFPKDTPTATDDPDEQDVICTVAQTVQSGETYRLDLGSVDVSQDALDPWMDATIGLAESDTAHAWRARSAFTLGSGSTVTATKVSRTDSNPAKAVSQGRLRVLANTDTTFKLGAAWKPTDANGLHGTLSVNLENPGPGSLVGSYQANHRLGTYLHFVLPQGSKAVRVPTDCKVGGPGGELPVPPEDVICYGPQHWLPKGFHGTFEFEVDLPDGAQGAPLQISSDWAAFGSTDRKGTTATTTVVLGDASSSGSPTPSATSDSSSPTLASTGASGVGALAALGLGAVTLGGGLLYLTTRRRKAGVHR